MEVHQNLSNSVFFNWFADEELDSAGTIGNSQFVSNVSIITVRPYNQALFTFLHAARTNQPFDFRSVMLLPSYSRMRLGELSKMSTFERISPNTSLSAGDIETLRFIYVTHRPVYGDMQGTFWSVRN